MKGDVPCTKSMLGLCCQGLRASWCEAKNKAVRQQAGQSLRRAHSVHPGMWTT